MSSAVPVSSEFNIGMRVHSPARANWFAPLAVFALALALRIAAVMYWNFRGLYGLDAYSYYDYSMALREALLRGQPLPHFFWPLAYPALVVLASFFVGQNPFSGQVVSLVSGSLLVLFTFLLAEEIARLGNFDERRGRWVAWIAALWLTFSAQLIQYSTVIMADALGLALAVGSAWMLTRYARTRAARFLYLSAAILAFAFLARIQMALLIFPWTAFTLSIWKSDQGDATLTSKLRAGVIAGVSGVLIVVPYLVWAWREAQLGLSSYAADPGFAQWNPLNLFRRDFITPDGHLQFPYPSGIYYAVAAVRGGALTPFLIPSFVLGVIELWRRRAVGVLIFLLGWCAAIYFFIGGLPWQNLRFAFPLYPPLAIVGAIGLSAIGSSIQMPRVLSRLGTLRAVMLMLLLILATQLTLGYLELDKFMTTTRNYSALAEWLTRELPPDATLVTFTISEILQHETKLHVREIYFETPETLTELMHGVHNYLLIDVSSVETQWVGRAPALDYEFLRDRVGLEEIGSRLTYTLFQIKPCC